jgi:hypothetical protein
VKLPFKRSFGGENLANEAKEKPRKNMKTFLVALYRNIQKV